MCAGNRSLYRAFVFKGFGDVHRNLGGQSMLLREYWSADHGSSRRFSFFGCGMDTKIAKGRCEQ